MHFKIIKLICDLQIFFWEVELNFHKSDSHCMIRRHINTKFGPVTSHDVTELDRDWFDDCFPDNKVYGVNMGPTWGRQDPGGPHVGPMNLAIWVVSYSPSQLPNECWDIVNQTPSQTSSKFESKCIDFHSTKSI